MVIGGEYNARQNGRTPKRFTAIDEIWHYQDARFLSAFEATSRPLSLLMVENEPFVERIESHLEGHHTVYYKEGEHENEKAFGKEKSAKLIAYFSAN